MMSSPSGAGEIPLLRARFRSHTDGGRSWRRATRAAAYTAAALALAAAVTWLGLHVSPRPLLAYDLPSASHGTVSLPTDLPAPVLRYYRATFGDAVPVVDSAVITAHGDLTLGAVTLPARFRFTHVAGQAYRHYIDADWFGLPIIRVNEWFIDGRSRLEVPGGPVDNDPNTNSAAAVGMWMESAWLPSVFVTDPAVRWQAIDDSHALQIVPTPGGEGRLTVTFDRQTGLIQQVDTMRFRSPEDVAQTPYRGVTLAWRDINGLRLPSVMMAQWMDQPRPVFTFVIDDIVYNADVTTYIRTAGP